MSIDHVHRKMERSPEERARLQADRVRYQKDRPTPQQLLVEGGHTDFVPIGELLELHQIVANLKHERERQGLTLAQLSERCQIDQATLSKLENGRNANPTLDTLSRVAAALGKRICCTLQDAPGDCRQPAHA